MVSLPAGRLAHDDRAVAVEGTGEGRVSAGGGKVEFVAAPAYGEDGHLLFSASGIALWTPYVEEFLKAHDKVRITVVFRGRQNQHKDLGLTLLKNVQARLAAVASVEQAPTADHNRLYMMLTPKH